MRTRLLRSTLLIGVATFFALPLASRAQVSTEQLQQWLNLPTSTSHIGNITGNAKAAAPEYRRFCVGCHGEMGDGNGEVAQWLDPPMYPKPRDFQLGVFKCRSTPTGTLPTDEDLFDTIARGLDRSKADTFVGMYVNDWTLDYGDRGRNAIREFLGRGVAAGLIPHSVQVEFVEDAPPRDAASR